MSLLANEPGLRKYGTPHVQERLHSMTSAPTPDNNNATKAEDALTKFGARVREFRKARGLTQHQLAESAGIDRKTINRIENTRYSPTLTNVFAIADALDVPANKLL